MKKPYLDKKKMMIRYMCALIFLCCLPSLGWGQYTDSGNHGFMLITTKEASETAPKGSPYFGGDDFNRGIVRIANRTPLDVWLRYDVMKEVMEIKLNANADEVYRLPLEEEVVYEMGPMKFKADRLRHDGSTYFGYFVEYYSGESIRLLGKPQLEVHESVQPKSGYSDSSDRIKIDEEYFVIWENGNIEKVRTRHRDIRNLFESDVAQDYLKDNRVRSIEDLTAFVAFYDKNMPRGN